MKKPSKPVLLAIATASVFAAAVAIAQTTTVVTTSPAASAGIKCYGINSCQGKSACQTSSNACSGKNACKTTGYLMAANQQECITKGGSLTEPTKTVTQSATQPYGSQ